MRWSLSRLFGGARRPSPASESPAEDALPELPLPDLMLPEPPMPAFMVSALTRTEPRLPELKRDRPELLMAAPAPAPAAAPVEVARAPSIEQAERHVAAGESGEALALLRSVVAAEPDRAAAWHAIAGLEHQAGDYGAAWAAWERCLALAPGDLDAAFRLARMVAELGRPMEAVRRLEAILAPAPAFAEVQVTLACQYAELKWLDRAQASFAAIEATLTGWQEKQRQAVARLVEAAKATITGLEEKRAAGGKLSWDERLERAQAEFALGNMAFCRWATENLAGRDKTAFAPCRLRAQVIAREEGVEAALAYLRDLRAAFDGDPAYLMMVAAWLHEAGAYAEAAAALACVIAVEPCHDAFRLQALGALCLDDAAGLTAVSPAWQAFETSETAPHRYAIAAARLDGRIVRLGDVAPAGDGPPAWDGSEPTILQFWHDPQIPADVTETMASWSAMHPGLRHLVFDSAAARVFIAETGEAGWLACYDAAGHPAMQSDLFRLVYLARHGGVYVDADERCQRDMGRVFAALAAVELVASLSTETPPYVFDGFIAVRPESPVIVMALAEAVRLLTQHRATGLRSDTWQVTGPGLLTRAIGRAVADRTHDGRIMLLGDAEYRSFACTNEALAYKHAADGNGRLT